MTPMMWVTFAASIISMLVGLIAIYNFGKQKGQAKVEEGKKQEQFSQIKRDLEAAWAEIRSLKGCTADTDKVLVEIKTTLRYIKESVDEIKENWNRHMEERDA